MSSYPDPSFSAEKILEDAKKARGGVDDRAVEYALQLLPILRTMIVKAVAEGDTTTTLYNLEWDASFSILVNAFEHLLGKPYTVFVEEDDDDDEHIVVTFPHLTLPLADQ
jgi:hypothetical protein